MTPEERASGRRRVIALAIQWGDDTMHVIHPYDIHLALDATPYGLPSLRPGEMGSAWATRVREVIQADHRADEEQPR